MTNTAQQPPAAPYLGIGIACHIAGGVLQEPVLFLAGGIFLLSGFSALFAQRRFAARLLLSLACSALLSTLAVASYVSGG